MGHIIPQVTNNHKFLRCCSKMYNISMSENPVSHETAQDLLELPFSQVKRGDIIRVQTHHKILKEDRFTNYEIKVTGVRNNGLSVEVVITSQGSKSNKFTARLVGGINERTGEHENFIKVSPKDHAERLFLKNLKHLDGERMGKSMSTAGIQNITLTRQL